MDEILDREISKAKSNYSWILVVIGNIALVSILVLFLIWKHELVKGRTTLFQDINWIIMLMGYFNFGATIFSYVTFKKYFKSCVTAFSFFIIAYFINLAIALIID